MQLLVITSSIMICWIVRSIIKLSSSPCLVAVFLGLAAYLLHSSFGKEIFTQPNLWLLPCNSWRNSCGSKVQFGLFKHSVMYHLCSIVFFLIELLFVSFLVPLVCCDQTIHNWCPHVLCHHRKLFYIISKTILLW